MIDPGGTIIDASQGEEDDALMQAVREYLAAAEAGAIVDRAAFLSRHAAVAPALEQWLGGLDFVSAATHPTPTFDRHAFLDPASAGLIQLGDFKLVRELGWGGMGIVYEAVQISLGRGVAVKVLPFSSALDPQRRQRNAVP